MPATDQQTRPASLGAQVLLLTQDFNQFKAWVPSQFEQLGTNLDQLRNEMRDWMSSSKGRITTWWPVMAGIVVAFWYVLNLQNTSANKSLSDNISRMEVTTVANASAIAKITEVIPTLQQQNADSIRDRADQRDILKKVLDVQTGLLSRAASEQSLRASKDAEIETQFRALEGYANLTRVYDNRMFALLWEKAMGTTFPSFQYYPSISTPADQMGGLKNLD